jgi:hypothetical protein
VTYYSNGMIALRKICCIPNYCSSSILHIHVYQEKTYGSVKIFDAYVLVKVKRSSVDILQWDFELYENHGTVMEYGNFCF